MIINIGNIRLDFISLFLPPSVKVNRNSLLTSFYYNNPLHISEKNFK
jgi:hypothetical protein